MFVSAVPQRPLSEFSLGKKISSYPDRRTTGSSYSSRHRRPSGHHNIGVPVQIVSVDTPQHRGKGQQDQDQSCQPSVTPQGFMGYGHDSTGGSIPPPPGHTYDNARFRCTRCGHPFTSQAKLDRHSFVCGAAALLSGMFTPYPAQQNDQHQQLQPQLPAAQSASGYHQIQYQNHNHYRRT